MIDPERKVRARMEVRKPHLENPACRFAEQTGKGMPVALIAEEHFVGALK